MIYNPLDTFYKSQIGAVSSANALTIRVKGNFDSVVLLLRKDGEDLPKQYNMLKDGDAFSVDIKPEIGLYFYYFQVNNNSFIGLGKNFVGEITNSPKEFQLTIYDKEYDTPEWIKGGIIYQIFPDRFYRAVKEKTIENGKVLRDDWGGIPTYLPDEKGEVLNNDFFGGDLQGIIEKLDYISSLGVNCIYLNPIFKAYSNHRYDTGNYMEIDPVLGDLTDFKNLIKECDRRGIKVVLDGVFNHTGSDSIYFNKKGNYNSVGAYQSKDSPYYNWFNFISYPKVYESWWGIQTLPSTNKKEGGFVDYISGENGVVEFYSSFGIGGFRLDVVDELPAHFVKKIRRALKKNNPDAFLIGEVWEDASNKIAYGVRREYFLGEELDSVMNYPLKNAIIDFVNNGNSFGLYDVICQQIDHYPSCVLHSLMNILSTHDTFRILSALSGVNVNGKTKIQMANIVLPQDLIEKTKFKVKCATLLQYFLCGVPSVYYGDEVGMQGFTDPLNRMCFPWGKEDKSMLEWFIKIGEIRRNYSAFKTGEFKKIFCDKGVFVFSRADENSEILVSINLSDKEYFLGFEGKLTELFTDKEYNGKIVLESNSFGVFANL